MNKNLLDLAIFQVIKERGDSWCMEFKYLAVNEVIDRMIAIRKFMDSHPKYSEILCGEELSNKKQLKYYYNKKEKNDGGKI